MQPSLEDLVHAELSPPQNQQMVTGSDMRKPVLAVSRWHLTRLGQSQWLTLLFGQPGERTEHLLTLTSQDNPPDVTITSSHLFNPAFAAKIAPLALAGRTSVDSAY